MKHSVTWWLSQFAAENGGSRISAPVFMVLALFGGLDLIVRFFF